MASPAISVIVPVYNGGAAFDRCLAALASSEGPDWELIVVDDGSTDGSAAAARRAGARVLSTAQARSGPGHARNLGACVARAPLLCFIDADVLVRPDTIANFVALFEGSDLTAAFGSYDDHPAHAGVLSQYRNLLHHFVHQTGHAVASTFWSGCGAVRRESFLALGGFDGAYTRPSIEDIELGYRIVAANGRIRLAKHIQVKHLKRWTFWSILQTDIRDRALPWTQLIARTRTMPKDLNLDTNSRLSAVCVYGLVMLLALSAWQPLALLGLPVLVALLVMCNRHLYAFLLAQRGLVFLLRALPMHWLYFGYSALIFSMGMAIGSLRYRGQLARAAAPRALVPVGSPTSDALTV
ncbi:MAG TPA: glycosyltransferase family A protein [Chloroflexota bacterium]|nr:glycosyltransferase family A protein [Chloroflexota bacterium]